MANTILSWNDENSGHLGFKLRKGDKPVPNPLTLAEVGTVGPTIHEYTAAAGTGAEFWAVSAYDSVQEVPCADQALSYPALIIPNEALHPIAQAVGNGGVGFGPYLPSACEGYPLGGEAALIDEINAVVTSTSGRVFAFSYVGVMELTCVDRVVSLTKLLDMPAGTNYTTWAVALNNNKILICSNGVGYLIYDVAANTISLAHAQTSDLGSRGTYIPSLNKVILAGQISGANTGSFYFGVLDPVSWTTTKYELAGVTNGIGSYAGMLMASDDHVVYWPRFTDTAGVMSLSWTPQGVFTTALAPAIAYPNSAIGDKQGLHVGNDTFLAVGNGNAYLITAAGVTTAPLTTYAGAGAAGFTGTPDAAAYSADGGLLFFDGQSGNKVLHIGADRVTSEVFTPTTSDFIARDLPIMFDGDLHLFPQYANAPAAHTMWRINWTGGTKPPIDWPNSYLASGYSRQGIQRYM